MEKYIFPTTPKANPKAIIQGPTYRFTVLTDRLLRYEWAEDGRFEDRASTFAIHRDFPVPEFKVVDRKDLEISTEFFHLTYTKQKFSPESFVVSFSGNATKYSTDWRFGTPTSGNLGGTARTLDLVDGRCDMGDGVLSRAGYAVIDDSKSMLFDGRGWVGQRLPGERFDGYLFSYGHDYKAAIKAFYAISGKQPVIPRFALGNWWSRYYAYHQDEYIQLMDKFASKKIPLSVAVVDMDWHLVKDKRVPHAGWTGYTWNTELFPDPYGFRNRIHERRLKITLNDHPHSGVYSFEDSYEEMARFMGRDPSTKDPIVFDPTDPLFMQAYFSILHRNLEKVACDFWWIDWQQGPWSKFPNFDPLWLLNHFQYLDAKQHSESDKPLIFSRYGGPGSHRYPIGFSGDTVISWASLAFQPEFTATASNIGYGWWSHDIGGHIRGGRDDELTTRWVQLGVFSPAMRLHSTTSKWMSKEPWLYSAECEAVMGEFLRFRHRMVPYLYSQNVLGAKWDEPLVRPLYWEYPEESEAYEFPNEYFFGSELLVAPIVQPRDPRTKLASVKAWLPPGNRYVDIFTGTVYDGNRQITFYRPLDQYPVLAREGSIIALDENRVPANGCRNPDALEVLVVVGRDGRASVIEDPKDDSDSDTTGGFDKGSSRETAFTWDQKKGRLTAEVFGTACTFRFLGVHHAPETLRVYLDGINYTGKLPISVDQSAGVPGLVIKCHTEANLITIEWPQAELEPTYYQPRLEEMLLHWQVEFAVKDRLWKEIEGKGKQMNEIVGTLQALGYDEAIIGPVLELVLADRRLANLFEGGLGSHSPICLG